MATAKIRPSRAPAPQRPAAPAAKSLKQAVQQRSGTAIPARPTAPKLGISAPGKLSKVGNMPQSGQAMVAPFSVEEPDTVKDVATWLRGIDGLGAPGDFLDGEVFGVPKKYLVYGGIALLVLGGGFFAFKKTRGPAGAMAGFGKKTRKRRRR